MVGGICGVGEKGEKNGRTGVWKAAGVFLETMGMGRY